MSAEALFSVSGHVSISTESRPQTKGSQSPQEERCPCTAQVGTGRSEAAGRGACGRAGTQQGAHRPTPAPTPDPQPNLPLANKLGWSPRSPRCGPAGDRPFQSLAEVCGSCRCPEGEGYLFSKFGTECGSGFVQHPTRVGLRDSGR